MTENRLKLIELLDERHKVSFSDGEKGCKLFYDEILDYKDSFKDFIPTDMNCGIDIRTTIDAFCRLYTRDFPIKIFDMEIWYPVGSMPSYIHPMSAYNILASAESQKELLSLLNTLASNSIIYEFVVNSKTVYNFTLEHLREISNIDLSKVDQMTLASLPMDVFYIQFDQPVIAHNDDDSISHFYGAFVEIGAYNHGKFKFSYVTISSHDKIIDEDGEMVDDNHKTLFQYFGSYTFDEAIELVNNKVNHTLTNLTSLDKSVISAILYLCSGKADFSKTPIESNKYDITEFDVK